MREMNHAGDLLMRNIFIRLTCWFVLLTGALYFLYAILLWADKVGLPKADNNMSKSGTVLGCLLLAAIPIFLLWLGRRYNLVNMREGHHKASELFFSFLALLCTIVMLKIYYFEIVPIL